MAKTNPTNEDRAAWAHTALMAFIRVSGTDCGDSLADLLTDLMHWADRDGIDFADMGKLLGASGQSVYKWESGEARPRAANMPGIAAVRSLGRRDVEKILASLARKG